MSLITELSYFLKMSFSYCLQTTQALIKNALGRAYSILTHHSKIRSNYSSGTSKILSVTRNKPVIMITSCVKWMSQARKMPSVPAMDLASIGLVGLRSPPMYFARIQASESIRESCNRWRESMSCPCSCSLKTSSQVF